jgi:hypothetical protein
MSDAPVVRTVAETPGGWLRALPLMACVLIVEGSQTTEDRRYPVFSEANLVSAMKVVGGGITTGAAAVARSDYAAAKLQFLHAREELAPTITFWRDRKREDALKMLRTALSRLDELDTALSTQAVERTAVKALIQEVDAACQACHAVYREVDPATNAFRLKRGALD